MVCERGGRHDVTKLLDFGLVLPVVDAGDDETLTHEGVIAGTPAYMSPEQASGQKSWTREATSTASVRWRTFC